MRTAARSQASRPSVEPSRRPSRARPTRSADSARSSDSSSGRCEVLVDEGHSHRPLADGGGAAFGGTGADIAGGEDAGHARLEQVVGPGCVAGEDEAVGGAYDCVVTTASRP